ncbi:hypothetical protein BAAM0499_05980 [Bifidobacterium animalis subsp. animalis MCC 0499]|uniref:phage tail protein n=1 Tax=Bifidobacterium animalis TaxID=28025 RepID=UPI000699BD51|nr:hypothetical protein [Bifidobacterium animalis]KOA60787.1 hypothetical protein BAAM0499_05980 [Bifidobacterium animalis subsp. animalis MCC 0499]
MAGNIVGKATMPIYPTMNGFRSAVLKETKAIGRTGGNTFAKAFGDGGGKQLGSKLKAGFDQAAGDLGDKALKGYQRDVAAASHAASTAMLNQKAAANQVKAAEEALAKAIAKHGENSTQAEAAQIRLEKANLRLADANGKAETATMRLRDSQKALAEAQAQASASAERTAASISGSFRNLGKTAMQPLSTAVTGIGQRLNAVTGPVKTVGAKITGTFAAARDKTVQAFTGLQTRAGGILTNIGNGAKTAFNHLPVGAQNALRSTGGYLSNLGSAAGQAFGALGNGAKNAFSSLGSHARNAATTIGTHLKTAADNAYASLEHVASVSMAGLAAGAAAVGAKLVSVGKQAFSLYASYEQTVGGIDTLFKNSSATVQKYAAQAYKTAGVDANTYMEQITSFSASLISSLGGDTAKAAELGNTAMIDMSDNANKMGTSIESIQQTYQSLARGNYAMLDNLKLGYGGTKTEMQRLIADANKVRAAHGEMADLSIDKFSDVVTAIHTMQTQLGITGTTAKEASTTIEGSINSMKAAWTNWLTGLGRNDVDMGQMTDQLVAAISDVIKNAAPRIKQIASSLVKSLPKMFSSLTTLLPEPFQKAFDGIGQTIGKFKGIIAPAFASFGAIGLKGIAPLLSNIPMLGGLFSKLAAPISAVGGPITAIIAAIGALIATSPQLRSQFAATFAQVGKVLGDTINMMMPSIKALGESFGQMLQSVMPALQELASTVIVLVSDLITTTAPLIKQLMVPLSAMLRQMMPIIGQVVTVLANAASSVLPPIVGVIEQILPSLASLIEQLIPLVPAILQPLMDIIVTLVPVIQQIVAAVAPVAAELLPMLIDAFSRLIPPVTEIINAILPTLVSLVQQLAPVIADVIGAIMQAIKALLPVVKFVIDLIVGYINNVALPVVRGMLPVVQSVITTIANVVRPLAGVIKGVVDVIAGIFTGDWNRVWSGISGIVRNAVDAVKNIFSGAVDIGRHFVEGIWNGISAAGGWLWQQVSGFFGNLKKNVLGFFGIHSPSRWFRDKVGKMLIKGLAVGIDQESGTAYRQMDAVSRELSRHATVGAKYSAAYQTAANPRNGYMDNSTHITQQFATKVVRSDADLYSASSILMRNALHEGRIYAR